MEMKLRGLYEMYGYYPFKMSKFEEYNFYSRNKGILVSEGVITFTDTTGKLMALKPDVTLSIVKNYRNGTEGVQRLYYNENVYRISDKTHSYKEINQMGLECMGDITEYNIYEVVRLAAMSLSMLSEGSVLNISNLDVLSAILKGMEPGQWQKQLLSCIGDKNPHGVKRICEEKGVDSEHTELLMFLTKAYGTCHDIVSQIKGKTDNTEILRALEQLENIVEAADDVPGVKLYVDMSLIKDAEYYNGVVFQGFIKGVPSGVLSGGQYDCLMKKMDKDAKAIGFAVYLDLLQRLSTERKYDTDVLLIYGHNDDYGQVLKRAVKIAESGRTVSAQTCVPDRMSYEEIIKFED
ncbi:MAG: hypothetical protein GX663_03780 [Clostridiales bacterium]|nr:hypothetical protein [Clostridiales bacterium]